METPKEYYYTYYSYEEWSRGYFGSRGCKCLPEEDINYFGSFYDKTFKPTQKIILKSDYATREEAYADEIILQRYYKVVENPHFANRAYQTSTKFYVSKEQAKKGDKTRKKLGLGLYSLTPKQRTENGKIGSSKAKEKGVGIFGFTTEQRQENSKNAGKYGGKKAKELGVGIHGFSKEQRVEVARKSGYKTKELGVGIHGLTKEERIENAKNAGKLGGKVAGNQKWMCEETGFISNAGGLSKYQKAKGIDTSKRVRIA